VRPFYRARLTANAIVCAMVASSVAYSYFTYAGLALTRPSPADYARATAHVRAHFQAGDLVDANPFWATRVRESLGDLPFASFKDLGREDLTPYRRVWLFSLFGAERRDRIEAAMRDKAVPLEDRQFGGIDVRLYGIRRAETIGFDFRQALDRARVWIDAEGERSDCAAWDGHRWRCSEADWNYVGREILEIDGEPRAIIWAHPVARGRLTIEFERVPLGRAMTVGAGFTAEAAARYGGAPVVLEVQADGRILSRRAYDASSGFARQRIETPDLAGSLHRVAFTVTTADDRLRHFCFQADVRGEAAR
jgi:hypothetical protein